MSQLQSVVTSQNEKGEWVSVHIPSGKSTTAETPQAAESAMRELLGMDDAGVFAEPLTSDRFSGPARDIALFLEGEVSQMLAAHSGFARLEAYENGVAHIKLGGGCEGCPASQLTLIGGVKVQLQERFSEEVVTEVVPVS